MVSTLLLEALHRRIIIFQRRFLLFASIPDPHNGSASRYIDVGGAQTHTKILNSLFEEIRLWQNFRLLGRLACFETKCCSGICTRGRLDVCTVSDNQCQDFCFEEEVKDRI